MRPYELVVIFDAGLEENVISDVTDKIASFVKDKGGTPTNIERWGRRTFAYEIDHRSEGYYVFIEVLAEPTVLAEVDRMLALSDDVLRHRVIRQPEKTTAPAPKKPAAKVATPADVAPATV